MLGHRTATINSISSEVTGSIPRHLTPTPGVRLTPVVVQRMGAGHDPKDEIWKSIKIHLGSSTILNGFGNQRKCSGKK